MAATNNPQHMDALRRANEIRLYRADLKKRIASGEESAATHLLWYDDKIEGMLALDLLTAIPRVGTRAAERWLQDCWAPPNKLVGTLTHRQRSCLVDRIQAWERRREAVAA